MRGVVNLGQTCYLGAALRVLLHTPPLVAYLLSGCVPTDSQPRRHNAHAVLVELAGCAKRAWKGTGGDIEPSALHAALGKACKGFTAAKPHDAHEATLAILGCLHDALAKTPKIAASPAARCVDRAAWDAHFKTHSIVSELFHFQIRKTITASDGATSTVYDHPLGADLPLSGGSLASCFSAWLTPETMEDGRVVTSEIVWAPLVLIVNFKRRGKKAKNDAYIDYGTHFDLAGAEYTLYAVIVHRGSGSGGHYTAMCENHGEWHIGDDTTVAAVPSIETVITKDAVVLMYKRKP